MSITCVPRSPIAPVPASALSSRHVFGAAGSESQSWR